ncbi:MAG: hypothetical protein AAB443_01175 [Patescibacteria group bacterium]
MFVELKFLLILLFSFVITFGLSPLLITLLFKFNIRRTNKVDLEAFLPDRSVKFGKPIMGGIVIIICLVLVLFLFLSKSNFFFPFLLILILGAFFGAVDEFINTIGRKGVSFAIRETVDSFVSKNLLFWKIYKTLLIPWDLFKEMMRVMGSTQRGLKTHDKFMMQTVVALIGCFWVYFILGRQAFWFPFLGDVNGGVLYFVLLLFLALVFANAFGVTDGMDGLSAGLHSISFLAYGCLALLTGNYDLAYFCAAIVGSELAFLYFNIHPARFEMSDVGTLPLGMLFVFIAAALQKELSMFFIGGIFLIEILSSFIQQWSAKLRHGKRVFLLAPIHHHFEKKGWPETKVTMRFWLFSSIFAVIGLVISLIN